MSALTSRTASSASLQSTCSRANMSPQRVSVHSFNLNLASVLNDPKQGRCVDMFTKDWGESFVPNTPAPSPHLKGASIEEFASLLGKFEDVRFCSRFSLIVTFCRGLQKSHELCAISESRAMTEDPVVI
jgi:hypothetical protein